MSTPGIVNFPTSLDDLTSLIRAANDAYTTLTADLQIGDTVATVASTSLLPSDGIVVIDDEIIPYSSKTPTTLNGLVRGYDGTAAAFHASGADVEALITARDHNVLAESLVATQTAMNSNLISVVWGTPSAESSNSIEVLGSCLDFVGQPFLSGLVDIEIKVSDAANDTEPSSTAIISPATSPIGTILSGNGTATTVFRTDSNGQFKVKVTETSVGSRYLWIKQGGHSRLFVRSSVGVLQLTFS